MYYSLENKHRPRNWENQFRGLMFIFQKRLLQEQKNRTISLTNIDFGHRAKKQNNLPSMSKVYVSERKFSCFCKCTIYLDAWSIFNHNKGWYHPSPPCRSQTKMSFFLTSLFKKALRSRFLGKQRGCAPFQGYPQVQYSCKTLMMLTAPNMDPQTIKIRLLYSLTKKQ